MMLRRLRKPRAIDDILARAGRGDSALAHRGLPVEVLGLWCLAREMSRAKRLNSPLAVGLLMPLAANGEPVFSKALEASIEALKKTVRGADVVAWHGESSILAILPDTPSDAAHVALSRWRDAMWHRSLRAGGLLWTSVLVENAARFEDSSDVIWEAKRLAAGA